VTERRNGRKLRENGLFGCFGICVDFVKEKNKTKIKQKY
jgi:hypothetical protein